MIKKAKGIILLAVGAFLLYWGHDVAGSLKSQFKEAITGSPTDKAVYLYVAGGICAALGLYKIFDK